MPLPLLGSKDDFAVFVAADIGGIALLVVATAAKQRKEEKAREIFIVLVAKREGSCVYFGESRFMGTISAGTKVEQQEA